MPKARHTPLALIILDGFGYSPRREGNAIALARTPHFDDWFKNYPNTFDNYSREISLPVYYNLTEEQTKTVIEAVIDSVQKVLG